MWQYIIPALTTLATAKYASNTRNDSKANIGSGTQPGSEPAAPIQINPVQGSQVKDFGDFEIDNMTEPENLTEEEQLMAMLQEAGIDPEGLLSMAFGGAVQYRGNGGVTGLIDPEKLKQMEALVAQMSGRPETPANAPNIGVDFSNPEPIDPYSPDALEISMNKNELKPSMPDETMVIADYAQDLGDQTKLDELEYYSKQNPEMFKAGLNSITQVLSAVLTDRPDGRNTPVATKTLAGNSNRRRNGLSNITPIGGSKVTFANQGSTLQRPMFMPNGGQMRGPGGPKDDLIPVMASNGEYMLSKAAVDAAGNGSHAKGLANLEAFNKMGNKRYG